MMTPHETTNPPDGLEAAAWLMEFPQAYDDGLRVAKKGVTATPMVIRKYGIGPREVMAFSSHEGARRALTVFHFHPDFPEADRRAYMETHAEGRDLAAEVAEHAAEISAARKAAWRERGRKWAKTAALAAQAVAIFVIAHLTVTR